MVTAKTFETRRTVREALTLLGLTKPTLHARLRRLRQLGYQVEAEMIREGRRGPRSQAFTVKPPPFRVQPPG